METSPAASSTLALEQDFPLLDLIDKVRESEEEIARRVEDRRVTLARSTGLTGRPLSDRLARELVEEAAEKSGLIGAAAALPFSLPLLGPILTTLLVVPAGAVWATINEVELCYSLAAAYQIQVPKDKLRLVSFWLVRLSTYDELHSKALQLGVRLTVRKLIEKLIAIGLTRAFAVTASGMMAGMMGRSVTPWYARATAFLGVPVIAILSWQSAQSVGERAIAYFTEELDQKT